MVNLFLENWRGIFITFMLLYVIRRLFLVGNFSDLRRNIKGKVVIVTGASAGIGKETAKELLQEGAEVIFACRDKQKTMKVWKEIEKKDKNLLSKAHFIELNLLSFKSVHNFVREFKSKFSKLDILINNAAVFPTFFEITDDKLESIYQVNYFSLVVLTLLLLDHFDFKEGRVINLVSFAHIQCDFTVEKINQMKADREFKSVYEEYFGNVWLQHYHYANTKTCAIYFTNHLAEYLSHNKPHIKAVNVNPGLVYTEFARFMYASKFLGVIYDIFFFMYIYIAKTALAGAQTTLHVVHEEFPNVVNGGYYSDCKLGKMSNLAANQEVREAVMKFTSDLLRDYNKDVHPYLSILK